MGNRGKRRERPSLSPGASSLIKGAHICKELLSQLSKVNPGESGLAGKVAILADNSRKVY